MLRSRHVKKMKSVKAKFAKEYHGKSMAMEKKFTDEISKLKKVVEDSEKFCGKIGSTLAHERDEAQRTIAALKVKHERSEARCQEIQQSAKAYKDQAEGLQRKLEKLQNDRDPGKWKLKYEKKMARNNLFNNVAVTSTTEAAAERPKKPKKKKKKKAGNVSYKDMMAQITKPKRTESFEQRKMDQKMTSLIGNGLGGGKFAKMKDRL